MRAARSLRLIVALIVASVALSSSALAQTTSVYNLNSWYYTPILNDTCAIAMQDSSLIVDMSKFRYATLKVKILVPKGAAEPWATVRIRAIGCTASNPDSNNSGILELQPIADHSYIGSAAGDSLGYGAWVTANAITSGNGDITIHAQRPNSKWAYPGNCWFFSLGNKGQEARVRYFYIQSSVLAAGGTDATRVIIGAQLSN